MQLEDDNSESDPEHEQQPKKVFHAFVASHRTYVVVSFRYVYLVHNRT